LLFTRKPIIELVADIDSRDRLDADAFQCLVENLGNAIFRAVTGSDRFFGGGPCFGDDFRLCTIAGAGRTPSARFCPLAADRYISKGMDRDRERETFVEPNRRLSGY
jgi:hypothetical protein